MLSRSLALLLAAALLVFRTHAADRTVYRCVLAGVTTFSDRPCGESIEVHTLDATEPTSVPAAPGMAAGASGVKPQAGKPARAAPAGTASAAKREDARARECVRLDAQLRRLRARMRAGYSAAEGERLRERQRAASERRRASQCR